MHDAATLGSLLKYEEIKAKLASLGEDPEAVGPLLAEEITTHKTLVDAEGRPLKQEDLQDDDYMYGIKRPLKSCKHCYNRGIEGWRQSGKPILCRCLKRNSPGEWITWKEFRALSNYFKHKD